MQQSAWKTVQEILEREKVALPPGRTAEDVAKAITAAVEPQLPPRHAVGGIITPQ